MKIAQIVKEILKTLPPEVRSRVVSRKLWMTVAAIAINHRNPAAVVKIVLAYLAAQGAEDAAKGLNLKVLSK